jgi:hypothetical protein
MTHYVYKVHHPKTLEYYIGVRSCNGKAIEDIDYMGSMYTWHPNKSELIKTILDDKFQTRIEANKIETKLIKECIDDPLNRNYHIPDVGFCCKGISKSDEHKRKLSESRKLLFKTNPKTSENNRNAQIKRWKSNEVLHNDWCKKMTVINASPEYRKKQRNSAKNRFKPVLQYDKTGTFIKEYESIRDASRQLNVDKTPISKNCNGNIYKSAYGFVWKFK